MIPERPKLRPVECIPASLEGQDVMVLRDPENVSGGAMVLSPALLYVLAYFDGEHTIKETQTALAIRTGEIVPADKIEEIVKQLDEGLFLDSERFRQHFDRLKKEFREAPFRACAHAGTAYPADAGELAQFLDTTLATEEAEEPPARDGALRGIIAPHIDMRRGAASYSRTYREIAASEPAETYVILGTAHSGGASISLTDKDFQTPLGVVSTDRDLVDSLAGDLRAALFEEELLHRSEHTIEFQVLLLQHALRGKGEFKIVPILCGRLSEIPENPGDEPDGSLTEEVEHVSRILRNWAEDGDRKCCFVASADLSHVGARFGQNVNTGPLLKKQVEIADRQLLDFARNGDPDGFLDFATKECVSLNVCGIPPVYIFLKAIEGTGGELLCYEQSVEEENNSMVTFAGLAYFG